MMKAGAGSCHRIFILIVAGIWMGWGQLLYAGNGQDTLAITRGLIEKGEFDKAFTLLKEFQSRHTSESSVAWMLAELSYWTGAYDMSDSLYQHAASLDPGNTAIRTGHANMLSQTGRLSKASAINTEVLRQDSENPAALLNKARIAYYRGDMQEARTAITRSLSVDPENPEALKLKGEIGSASSPWIFLGTDIRKDDQPLRTISPGFDAGLRHKAWLNPRFGAVLPFYQTDSSKLSAFSIYAGNEFLFTGHQLRLEVRGGIHSYPGDDRPEWTTDLLIGKKVLKHLDLSTRWQRKPYSSTVMSLKQRVIEEALTLRARWNRPEKLNGELIFHRSAYPMDDNHITSFAGWIFVPVIATGHFTASLGYGYSYSDAQVNKFSPISSLEDILANSLYLEPLQGIYNPYFTPEKQYAHSALASMRYTAGKGFSIDGQVNYGFIAGSDNPYLYVDRNGSGQVYLVQAFEPTTFHPADLKLGMSTNISAQMSLSWEYHYSRTLYYESTTTRIYLMYRL